MNASPTQNSLKHLRDNGYKTWVVEHWNSFTKKRVDLFNAWDIIAVRKNEVLFVQTTSWANTSARINKIADNEYTPHLRDAGIRLEVHGWAKKPQTKGSKRLVWTPKIIDVS